MPPVLVTISGMVGTGKSTAAKHVLAVLEREGLAAASWRFRSLPCFTLRPRRPHRAGASASSGPQERARRGRGYRRKPLTMWVALGYALRMISFRAFRRWSRSVQWAVTNRYFYDNLVHYELDAPAARRYTALLRRLMPRPELAILMVASTETIASRRPQYSTDYVRGVARGYDALGAHFPELIELSSDPGSSALERVEAIVRQRLLASRRVRQARDPR